MITIRVSSNLKELTRKLDDFAKKQVPYATAQALNAVAQKIKDDATAQLTTVFDNPTRFTRNAYGITRARKSNLTAVVFAKDIQARYLAPSETGGDQVLSGGATKIATPVDITRAQWKRAGAGKFANLLGRPDVFVERIHGILGVWQRLPVKGRGRRGAAPGQRLRLLLELKPPKPVKTRLDYRRRAMAIVKANLDSEFRKALAKAIATAR